MRIAVALTVIFASSALAVPIDGTSHHNTIRTKKSSYGPAASWAAGPPLAPLALYLAPQGPSIPNYREEEHMMEDHVNPSARSYYDSTPLASLVAASAAASSASSASGPAYGIFPNAKTSGCAVPLLLSCAPNVISGSLAKSHATYPAYRSHDAEEDHPAMRAAMEKAWSEMGRSLSHNDVSADHPENQYVGNDHVVSVDFSLPHHARVSTAAPPSQQQTNRH